jgi:pimeloyl-ACP methyl ester carboxylesterase
VGWRLALKHPERVSALIVQNGNAYDEGLKEFWDPIKAYWSDHAMLIDALHAALEDRKVAFDRIRSDVATHVLFRRVIDRFVAGKFIAEHFVCSELDTVRGR